MESEYIIILVFLGISFMFIPFSINYLIKKKKRSKWPRTQAIITYTYSRQYYERDYDKETDITTVERGILTDLEYEYKVSGEIFSGRTQIKRENAKLEQMEARYQKGNTIEIAYDPTQPAVSTNKFEFGVGLILGCFVIPVLFLLAPIFFVLPSL